MANAVCMGAMLKCSFGVAPSSLVVLPLNRVMSPQPVANIMTKSDRLVTVPEAVYSQHSGTVDCRRTDRAAGQHADLEQQCKADVHVGGGH